MSAAEMWTSKLGNKYPMDLMQKNDSSAQKELKRLRSLSGNNRCADCNRQDSSWSSVSHGVFICVICSDVHRSVGTHVTKVKGCTGTYLWGPDELQQMQSIGNRCGEDIYGAEKIDPDASKERKQRYVVEKYEKRSFAGKPAVAQVQTDSANPRAEQEQQQQQQPVVRRTEPVKPRLNVRKVATTPAPQPCALVKAGAVIPDSLFDDLFADFDETQGGYFQSSSQALKSSPMQNLPRAPANVSLNDHSLDAFLNTTLHVAAEKTTETDPFADWLAF